MAGRYIPPALRRQQKPEDAPSSLTAVDPSTLPKRRLEDLRATLPNQCHEDDIQEYFGNQYSCSTLHDSAERRDKLAYVKLFWDANPRWEADKIIFVKTSLFFLPGYVETFEMVADGDLSGETEGLTLQESSGSSKGQSPNTDAESKAEPAQGKTLRPEEWSVSRHRLPSKSPSRSYNTSFRTCPGAARSHRHAPRRGLRAAQGAQRPLQLRWLAPDPPRGLPPSALARPRQNAAAEMGHGPILAKP